MKQQFFCLDDGGETFDRYTIIEISTGDMCGASAEPFSPLGFGQFCGNVADNYWNVAYGYQWRKGLDKRLLDRRIKFAINHFKNDCENIGKLVSFDKLPTKVQEYAKLVFSPDYVPY